MHLNLQKDATSNYEHIEVGSCFVTEGFIKTCTEKLHKQKASLIKWLRCRPRNYETVSSISALLRAVGQSQCLNPTQSQNCYGENGGCCC